jgi:hypothetical protein
MKHYFIFLVLLFTFFTQESKAQFAPHTIAGNTISFDQQLVIPVTVASFNNVASCNLRLTYNPSVVVATLVSKGPGLPGSLNFNVTSVPGVVSLGWYHSANVSLPDNSVLFNITFSQVGIGTSALNWYDNGNSCKYSDINSVVLIDQPTNDFYINGSIVILSPNAPQTIIPPVTACPGSLVSVPVIVNNFNYVGALNLDLMYDPGVLTYQSATASATFPGLTVTTGSSGHISVQGTAAIGTSGISIQSGSILTSLDFIYNGGYTALNWFDNGTSCQYTGPPPSYAILNDAPQANYYSNGTVSESAPEQCGRNLSIQVFIEGLYNTSGQMTASSNGNGAAFGETIADQVTIELHSAANYDNLVYSFQNVSLSTAGLANVLVPVELISDYYITIKHRNSISATSALPVAFSASAVSYNFSDAASKAYGSNQKLVGEGIWALYTGDINQDGYIDGTDLILADNAAANLLSGYIPPDNDGNGIVDLYDVNLIEVNASGFIKAVFPDNE